MHRNADPKGFPQVAVVGVFVDQGKPDDGIIELPSRTDPAKIDIILSDLLPPRFSRDYWRFAGSLTTPGTVPGGTKRCAEGLPWIIMKTPIKMSANQIQAFKDSSIGYWGTDVTNRPLQQGNGRDIISPFGGF